jgi:hypothetical protein
VNVNANDHHYRWPTCVVRAHAVVSRSSVLFHELALQARADLQQPRDAARVNAMQALVVGPLTEDPVDPAQFGGRSNAPRHELRRVVPVGLN